MTSFSSHFSIHVLHSIAPNAPYGTSPPSLMPEWPDELFACDFCDMSNATQSAHVCIGGCRRRVGTECGCGSEEGDEDKSGVLCKWCRGEMGDREPPPSRGRVHGRLRLVLFVFEPQYHTNMWPYDAARRQLEALRETCGLGAVVVFGARCAPTRDSWREKVQLVREFALNPSRHLPDDCLLDDDCSIAVQIATHCDDGGGALVQRGLVWGDKFDQRERLDWWFDLLCSELFIRGGASSKQLSISMVLVYACSVLQTEQHKELCEQFVRNTGVRLVVSGSDQAAAIELMHFVRLLTGLCTGRGTRGSVLNMFAPASSADSVMPPMCVSLTLPSTNTQVSTFVTKWSACSVSTKIHLGIRMDGGDEYTARRMALSEMNRSRLEQELYNAWPFAGTRVQRMSVNRYRQLFYAAAIVRRLSLDVQSVCALIGNNQRNRRNARLICLRLSRVGLLDPRAGALHSTPVSPRQLFVENAIEWRLIDPPSFQQMLCYDVGLFDRSLPTLRRKWLDRWRSERKQIDNVNQMTRKRKSRRRGMDGAQ